MSLDLGLFLLVAVVWAALALAYALVPMFTMPGAALLWGMGAPVFALIAWRIHRTRHFANPSRS